jgi:predicted membrane protein (TIGR00267 family)
LIYRDFLVKLEEIGPIARRLFINTLFDSTFTQLGIVIGSAFAANPNVRVVIGTLLSSSLALGISTGVSVYESETMERERKLTELEKALFRRLNETRIAEAYRSYARILSIINFITPLVCCAVILAPILASFFNLVSVQVAAWLSIALALIVLFAAGVYFARTSNQNPMKKGVRMLGFGVIAFALSYLIQISI